MKPASIFIGRPLHWALWVVLLVVLYGFGAAHFHVRHFVVFLLSLLAISATCLAVVLLTHRPGQRITREPFESGGHESQ